MSKGAHFSPELFKFLKELRKNNDREWFKANKERFESAVRDPFLRFIADFAPLLHGVSACFVADPRPSGGSLFRIHRDIRFSEDKSPYKTHVAAAFPHCDAGKDASSPVFYLHFEPGACFAAAGLWHPDSKTLFRVRSAITQRPDDWRAVRRRKFSIEGSTLTRPPKGFDPDHPFIEDLKRKDFVTSVRFSESEVCGSRFLPDFAKACRTMSPLVAFLTRSLDLEW
jgi:uncharacterized protein (TIGR02453 family)